MEKLKCQITNEIKCLDEYVRAMKEVYTQKPMLEDLENIQMHINNLKSWAGMTNDAIENSLNKRVNDNIKPPIGLTPRYIFEERRMQEIIDAIERYRKAKKPIPSKWIYEYNSYCR